MNNYPLGFVPEIRVSQLRIKIWNRVTGGTLPWLLSSNAKIRGFLFRRNLTWKRDRNYSRGWIPESLPHLPQCNFELSEKTLLGSCDPDDRRQCCLPGLGITLHKTVSRSFCYIFFSVINCVHSILHASFLAIADSGEQMVRQLW